MAEGRQIFSYKGVEYDLPSSYTPQQALNRIKSHLGESNKSGFEKFAEGLGAGIGSKDRAAAFTALTRSTPGSKEYKQAQTRLQNLGMADTADDSWQATTGRILGQAPLEIADFLTGGGVSEAAAGAEEYLRRARQDTTEPERRANAIKYARDTGVSNVIGAGVGPAASRLGTTVKQAVSNVISAAAPEIGQGRELTPEQIALNAVVGGGIGAVTHTKPKNKVNKGADKVDPEVAEKLKMYQERKQAATKPQVNPKDLTPADILTPAPAGTNFEMQLPGGRGTKGGYAADKAKRKAEQKLAEEDSRIVPDNDINTPQQMDMFVEDNKKVVQDELFKSALEESNAALRERQKAESARLLEQEQAPWRQEDEQLAAYQELFPIAENRALPTQQATPEFEQGLLFGASNEQRPLETVPQNKDWDWTRPSPEVPPQGRELTPFGEAGVKLYDESGRTISSRGMGVDTSTPSAPKEYPPFWKQVEENTSWDKYKQQQNQARQQEWSNGIKGAEKEATERQLYENIQQALESTPAPDYGMGRKTREFITEQTMSLGRRRGQQGGFIDPAVFVEGFKKAIDLVVSGVSKFKEFADYMITKFGKEIKPTLNQIWNASKEHVVKQKNHSLNVIQKYSMGVHEAAQAINDVNFSSAVAKIDELAGNIRDSFRNKFYGETYDRRALSSGVKYGRDKFSGILKNKALDSMLEKYKPYWNTTEYVDPEKIGFTNEELGLFLDLRNILDDVGSSLGVDVNKNPNYMPRNRQGTHAVISRTPEGTLHVEGVSSVTGARALEAKLKGEGHSIIKSGLRSDLMASPEYKSLIKDEFEPEGLRSPFSSHLKEASNVSGYAGQRNTSDMINSLQQYMNRAENELIRKEFQSLLPELEKTLSSDQMEVLNRYMETSIGLGFLHQPEWIKSLGNDIVRNIPALGYAPDVMNTISKATYAYKVMPSVANVLQALVSPIGAVAQLARLAGNEKLDFIAANKAVAKAAIRSLTRTTDATDQYIADRAIRSGYLQSMTDMVDIEKKLRAGNIRSVTTELAKDLFRAGRIELKVRKDFLTGMVNYYRSQGMDMDSAFHKAGRDTRNAFVGIRPEDRAPWVQSLGPLAGTVSALTTYPIGMAGKLYGNLGGTKGQLGALAVIGLGSIVVAGLRGSPVAESMEMANMLYNFFADDPDKVSSFDNYLIEKGKEYPMLTHGVLSDLMGADMARSLGWPSLFSLLPFWNQIKGLAQQAAGQPGDMGIATMPKMATDAVTAAYKLVNGEPMSDREKELAWQAVLPRFAQKMMDTNQVYDSKDKLIGSVTDESTMSAKATGSRSIEEAELRATEANTQTGIKELQKMVNQRTDKTVKAILYGSEQQQEQALKEYLNLQDTLGKYNQVLDVDELITKTLDSSINTKLTPEERAIFNGNLDEVLYRISRKQSQGE